MLLRRFLVDKFEKLLSHQIQHAKRATKLPPQTTSEEIFRVINGPVELLSIVGIVTTAIGAVANVTSIEFDPDAGVLAATELCAAAAGLDITGDAIGQIYTITGTVTDILQDGSTGIDNGMASSIILPKGKMNLKCAGSSVTGAIEWYVTYRPLQKSAKMIAK